MKGIPLLKEQNRIIIETSVTTFHPTEIAANLPSSCAYYRGPSMKVLTKAQKKSKRNPNDLASTSTPESAEHIYQFGSFYLNPAEQQLLYNGEPIRLTPKVFDLLLVLIQNKGCLVTKERLLKEVWPDAFVEEANLSVSIARLRKALDEGVAERQYIETVPKRGYRFVPPVSESHEVAAGNSRARNTLSTNTNGFLADMQSIAVLPFATLGAGMADEYLGLGIADALITKLSNLKCLTVRPTSAVRNALKVDPVSTGKELQVGTVLEGSIQKLDEDIRVTVQLVSVRDGATLWAEGFNEKFTNIFAIEDSISEQVAIALAALLMARDTP